MSANNQILIKYKKPSYFVLDKDIEAKDKYGYPVGNAKTLEKAVAIANAYLKKNMVEYGIRIKLPKKK